MSSSILTTLDYIERTIAELDDGIRKRSITRIKVSFEKLEAFSNFLKSQLPEEFLSTVFPDFDRHLYFIGLFLGKRDFKWIKSNFDDIKKSDLPDIKSEIYRFIEKGRLPKKKRETESLSKDIFLVHGRDRESLKELKSILKQIGLNAIVLHEQPSGSRTIIEKLEKYSNVGYVFVILTPDDVGLPIEEFAESTHKFFKALKDSLGSHKTGGDVFDEVFGEEMEKRARQNVVLEFGYFMGLLSRDRVCCLYKGAIEVPSDMHGIVYIPFKDSISEAKEMIIKELRVAGYKIKI